MVFSVGSVQSGYKEEFNWANYSEKSSFLGAEELNWVESSELPVAE
jgi:hypothetical protein